MHRFRVLQMSLDLIRELRSVVTVIRRQSPDLARQMERAATSVALNVAEGSRREGKDRSQRFRIAGGSADEVRCALQVAVAWGYVEEGEVAAMLTRIDGILGILWVLGRGRRAGAH